MDQLIEQLNKVLAETFSFYLKTQFFHWNVEGENFYFHHKFLEDIYSEVYGAVDAIAEHVRALDGYAAGSLTRFKQLSGIEDQVQVVQGTEIFNILHGDNEKLLTTLRITQSQAEKFGLVGLQNFLQDRVDQHKKHAWMLRATIKKVVNE